MKILLHCMALIPLLHPQGSGISKGGWLYHGGQPRLVRFLTKTNDAKDQSKIFLAPQCSGFIFISGETFSISASEPWGVTQLEYNNGVLHEKRIPSLVMGSGKVPPASEKHLTFNEALSTSIGEVVFDMLEPLCKDFLANPETLSKGRSIHHDYGHGAMTDIVLGTGCGAFLSYSVITPPVFGQPQVFRHVVCTFSVLSAGKE